MAKLLVKTQSGTPVSCIPMLRPDRTCAGMIFKTPQRTFVLGDFSSDFYMRSDGWSAEGQDPVALLENYCVHMNGPVATMNQEMTILHPDPDGVLGDGYEVIFADTIMLTFNTFNEV